MDIFIALGPLYIKITTLLSEKDSISVMTKFDGVMGRSRFPDYNDSCVVITLMRMCQIKYQYISVIPLGRHLQEH